MEVWSTQEELSFGWLLPPVVVGLVWLRRDELLHSMTSGVRIGLAIAIVAVVALVVFERIAAHSPAAAAAGLLLWSMAVYLWGWRAGRVLAFPMTLLTVGLAMQQTLLSPISFPMQQITAGQAAELARLIGLPIVQEGLVLRTDAFAFEVAEACSGMNSLLALLTLAALWIYVGQSAVRSRASVLLSLLPIVVLANTLRVVAVLVFASKFGEDAALGFFHNVSGFLLFGASLTALSTVGWLMARVGTWRAAAAI
jgi:exosortase